MLKLLHNLKMINAQLNSLRESLKKTLMIFVLITLHLL